jgi:hypothetical protein
VIIDQELFVSNGNITLNIESAPKDLTAKARIILK